MSNVWPHGYKCAACFTFDLDAEYVFKGNNPDVEDMPRVISQGDYVWRASIIPRILDLLDDHEIKATFFIVAMNAVNHPDVIAEIASRGHDIATHGWEHEKISHLYKVEETERLLKCVEALEDASGVRPVGNRTAGGELSPHTLDILAENGFIYDSSLRGSDMPYKLENGLIEIPSYYEMDDFHLFADYPFGNYKARMLSPETGYEIWTTSFDGYYKYGLCWATMFHPQIIGKPGNLMLLERTINYIKKYPDVWFANARQIAEFWQSK
ncbi:polysaccharide deacetylase family protein [Candidatus Bathyarchaeota archaeon]|jgi:peptidoglycan/xylan/chitin deacetylase (PgdA/CDA1 family)|nr:polysaccharide deacetylase family protein [Candidatus Bathyarchaeota archaeon]